jgi:hypothetical protein
MAGRISVPSGAMSYSSKPTPQEYAKLRTQPEHIRQEYEQRANQALKEMVEKERVHFQQQLDEYKEYAQGEIMHAWKEAEHWHIQTELIYQLLEEAEVEIKKEREEYQAEIEKLQREIKKLKADKRNRTKIKKITERD